MPLGGGTITTLATGQSGPFGTAVNATSIYWLDYDSNLVMKGPLTAGGTPVTLASGASASDPAGLAIDSQNVYWSTDFNVWKVSAAGGGTPVTLSYSATDFPEWVATDGTNVYWTTEPSGASGTVMKVPVIGGTPSTLASGQGVPKGIAVDAKNVYWVNGTPAAVMKIPIGGGTPVTLATSASALDIAVDATSVYWTGESGFVNKVTPK